MATVPDEFVHLLEDPNYGHLATVRPDGSPQVNPMWFLYDAESNTVRFTHTGKRAKFRNLQQNPAMAMEVIDPDDPIASSSCEGASSRSSPTPRVHSIRCWVRATATPRRRSRRSRPTASSS